MRVLHIANFSLLPRRGKRADDVGRYYSVDRKLSSGFARNGCYVWDFSYRDEARRLSPLLASKKFGAARMNAALLDVARQMRPDLILLGHAELVFAKTLQAMREMLPKARVAQWHVDPMTNRDTLRAFAPFVDSLFTCHAASTVRREVFLNNQALTGGGRTLFSISG